jgi:hypothetical protein
MPITVISLSGLKDIVENFSETQCSFYCEACSVALQKNGHLSETVLTVDGYQKTTFNLSWKQITSLAGWHDNDVVAENAAIAVAFFLITELTEYTIIRQAAKGNGFDYWLGYKKSSPKFDPNNFLKARLEVSGIFSGDESDLQTRVRRKLRQVDRSASWGLPAFVVVVEFGNCKAFVATK